VGKKVCTEENYQKLLAFLSESKHKKGALMSVLNECQKIYGCIPLNAQKVISEELEIPVGEIYGVVTFYSQFSLEPKGDYIIAVCMGTAYYVRDAQKLIDGFVRGIDDLAVGETTPDGKFTLEATRCIGACGLAPVLTVNEDVYGRLTEADVEGIIAKY
jgi:NADH-quinone oxidoreductase subunit E